MPTRTPFKSIWPDGSARDHLIVIGEPRAEPSGEWSCQVAVSPGFETLSRIHGVDRQQAEMLARQVVQSILDGMALKGARLLQADGSKLDSF